MTTYCRVNINILRIIPLRQAEAGMVLGEAAFNRNGQVVAEEGKTLDEESIEKFNNLNVRKIVVMDENVQWLPEEQVEERSQQLEVLERRTFEQASGDIINDIHQSGSIESLRQVALHLRKQAASQGDQESVDYVDNLIQRTYDLEDDIDDIMDQLKNVEDEQARQTLLHALEGKIRQLDQTFLEVAAPKSTIHQTISCCTEKEEIRTSLIDFMANNPKLLEETETQVEDTGKNEPPEIDDDESKVAESASQLLDDDHPQQALKSFIADASSFASSSHLVDELDTVQDEIDELIEDKESLKNQLAKMDIGLDPRKKIMNALDSDKTLRKSELYDLPVSESFAEETYDIMTRELETKYRLWESANTATDQELSDYLDRTDFIKHVQFDQSSSATELNNKSTPAESTMEADKEKSEKVSLSDTVASMNPEDIEIERILQELGTHDYEMVLDTINQVFTTGNIADELGSTLLDIENEIEELQERENEIRDKINNAQLPFDTLKHFAFVLAGKKKMESSSFFELDAPEFLLETVFNFVNERQDSMEEFLDKLDGVTEFDPITTYESKSDEIKLPKYIAEIIDSIALPSQVSFDDEDNKVEEDDNDDDKHRDDYDSFIEKIRKLDPYKLSNAVDLELSTLKDAKRVLAIPDNLTEEQEDYCLPLLNEAEKIFYGREIDDDALLDASLGLTDVMVDHDKPLKMLLDPPAGDKYLLSHGVNTCMLTLRLANDYGFDDSEILDLAASSLSLDFGMIQIPPGLWAKNEDLTQRADKEVKKHPDHSREIVDMAANGDGIIQDLVHQHHERQDGSGYPQGLKKGNQHPNAPLLGVADVYVAMMEDRVYRSPKSPDVAMKTLLQNKNQYDKSVVKTLVQSFGVYPNGTLVLLSDGRLGIVEGQNFDNLTKPKVMIVTDDEQNRLSNPRRTNLDDEDLTIKKTVKW